MWYLIATREAPIKTTTTKAIPKDFYGLLVPYHYPEEEKLFRLSDYVGMNFISHSDFYLLVICTENCVLLYSCHWNRGLKKKTLTDHGKFSFGSQFIL